MPERPFLPEIPSHLKYTLVLDLDETLIHFNEDQDFFAIRPGCQDFLRTLSMHFEIVIFTASV